MKKALVLLKGKEAKLAEAGQACEQRNYLCRLTGLSTRMTAVRDRAFSVGLLLRFFVQ